MKVILLHGSSGSKHNFRDLTHYLKPLEIISFDYIGFGNAQKPKLDYTLDVFLKDIEQKVRFEKGEKYVVVGHSLGAILAKELALRHSEVQKVFFINYPLNKEIVLRKGMNPLFIRDSFIARLMCKSKVLWKYVMYPFLFWAYPTNFDSVRDYFNHSYEAEVGVLRNIVRKDNLGTLEKLRVKVLFIAGSEDTYTNRTLLREYAHVLIGGMGHLFFGYEKEIAQIVKKEIGENLHKN